MQTDESLEIKKALIDKPGFHQCCRKVITEHEFGVIYDKNDNAYKGDFDNFVKHGRGLIQMNDGSVFLGYFCNNKLLGPAKYTSGKGFELCELLKEYPFDLRIFRYIKEAEGFFVDGLANGQFTVIFKETYEYVKY